MDTLKIISEFWPLGLKRAATKAEDYLNFLTGNNFNVSIIDEEEKN